MNEASFLVSNRRWLAGGLSLTFFSCAGQTYFISLFAADIRADFGLSHGSFGLVYMIATLASAATLVPLGRVVDRYAMLRVATGVILALSLACLVMGVARSVGGLVVAIYLLRLFGQGMMSHVAMTAMGRWFDATRGRAVSITALGYQISEGLLPLLVVAAVPWFGWRSVWFVAAGLLLLVALPLILRCWSVSRIPRGAGGGASAMADVAERGRQWTRTDVLRDRPFALVCTAVLAPAFIGTSVFFHQVHLTELKGWGTATFAAAFAMLAVVTIAAGLASGRLIDRIGAWRMLPYFLLPLSLACAALSFGQGAYVAWLFMALLGLSYGMSSSIFGAVWPELYGTRHLGAIRSVVFSGMVFASALGPGLTGWLIDLGVGFESQLRVMAVYCLLAAATMVPVVKTLGGRLAPVQA